MIQSFCCIVTGKITICIPLIWAPTALPSSCFFIASGEPLDIFTIPYIWTWPKGGDSITDGLSNNYTVVSGITVVVDISCSGFWFTCCMSVEMGAHGVSYSNYDSGNLYWPPGDLYWMEIVFKYFFIHACLCLVVVLCRLCSLMPF